VKNVIPEVDSKSMDIVADNISKLKELFPEAFTEGKVDFDALKEVLGNYIDGREERYTFTWNGKSKARMLAQTSSTGTLRPCKEESVDWDNTQNLFIEGDNLEVLKLLQKSYHKKVKMIYIDPPYNTGSDFVYKDNFKDNIRNYKEITGQVDSEGLSLSSNPETSGRYHTDWLNMMYPRLKLARNLLKDDGVIFISIDDNEIDNLRKLCSEIFGEENFVSELVWKSGRTAAAHFTNEHEYILCFAKDKPKLPLFEFTGEAKISDRAIKRPTIKNPVSSITFPAGIDFESEDKVFPSEFGGGEPVKIIEGVFESKNGKLASEVTIEAAWTMKDMIEGWIDGHDVFDQKGQKVNRFFFKGNGVLQYEKQKGTVHPKSIIEGFTTKQGGNEIAALLGKNYFDFPKPRGLIEALLDVGSGNSDIVCDFFAGSGTTGHAVLNKNLENGTNNRFVLVQLPEACDSKADAISDGYKTIAEISKERIRRAAVQIKDENPDYQGDLGFKVFKLDSTNIKPWELDFDLTEQDLEEQISNIKQSRKEEDVLYEVLLKYGLDLTLPITEHIVAGHKVFDIGMGALMICLSNDITLDVVEGIATLKDELKPEIMRVVFKDAGFADDVVKTNAVQILKQAGIEDVRSL